MLGFTQRGYQRSTPLNREAAPRAQEGPAQVPSRDAEPSPEDQSRITGLENLILARLDDDKAQDVVFIDLKGKSAVADGLIVASGRSHRHVGAMADHLLRALKDAGYGRCRGWGRWTSIATALRCCMGSAHLSCPSLRTGRRQRT